MWESLPIRCADTVELTDEDIVHFQDCHIVRDGEKVLGAFKADANLDHAETFFDQSFEMHCE